MKIAIRWGILLFFDLSKFTHTTLRIFNLGRNRCRSFKYKNCNESVCRACLASTLVISRSNISAKKCDDTNFELINYPSIIY